MIGSSVNFIYICSTNLGYDLMRVFYYALSGEIRVMLICLLVQGIGDAVALLPSLNVSAF